MITKDCLDCKWCYIDDIFYEARCKKPYNDIMITRHGNDTRIVCKDFEEDPDA